MLNFKKIVLALLLSALVVFPAMAVNTVTGTANEGIIEISTIDSDWDGGKEMEIIAIVFVPGAADDVMVIKSRDDTGATIFYALSTDAEPRVEYYFGEKFYPYIDFTDCRLNAGAKVKITIKRSW